jgi:hypothetical protein
VPKHAISLRPLRQRDPQLQCINEKIATLASRKPIENLYRVFSRAAQVAGDAIEATAELGQLSDIDRRAHRDALNFWHRVRDFNGTAALNCVGGNQTLPEALITLRLLRNRAADEEPRKPVQASVSPDTKKLRSQR